VITRDLVAFVRSSLPQPPARILEIGAGDGDLARELDGAGYAVTAIDPAAQPGSGVKPVPLLEARGTFDAGLAVVSLHHVDPLEESCAHLATLIPPGGHLVIDEIDVDRYDERASGWWLSQRRSLGFDEEGHDAAGMVERLREHVHSLATVRAALAPYFEIGEPIREAHLHRWELLPSLRAVEVDLIAQGLLPATGARLVGIRRG
jgi:SAM-dependent methyltransferase